MMGKEEPSIIPFPPAPENYFEILQEASKYLLAGTYSEGWRQYSVGSASASRSVP